MRRGWPERESIFGRIFGRLPTAYAEGSIESEGGIRKASCGPHLPVPADQRAPSAFAVGMLRDIEKKHALGSIEMGQVERGGVAPIICGTAEAEVAADAARGLEAWVLASDLHRHGLQNDGLYGCGW